MPIAREMIKNLGCTFTKDFFMNNPEIQDVMMYILLKEHHKYFKVTQTYDKYVGKIINGYYISQCGLLSMSHACGVGGTIEFLEAGCNPNVLPSGAPEADKRLTIQKYILVFDKDTTNTSSIKKAFLLKYTK